MAAWSDTLLSRIDDAGLNASAPPQQLWIDGWLVRFSPGKAKRARCIHAVAAGRLPVDERLALCAAVFRDAGLPLFVRITPFSQPSGLDGLLAARGMHRIDDTRVMVSTAGPVDAEPLPPGYAMERLALAAFAEQVGALRGSTAAQRTAHAERLNQSPVPYEGWVLRRREDGRVAACGQIATEAELVGLYDVFTDPAQRGQGLARLLCTNLLAMARARGASVAYLQVDAGNAAARAVYRRLGFADAYAYHYRSPEPDAH
ncbi:GNAT family N-acetyltransferase [Aquincola sp. S2]|uniref:GNAT family N-acetyltransferase n=1 Tax=Pseudaquabacterium terrae TaxID=2732868 RepID=A0ABX2ELD4_9BURK|nr:GNAT family N-acetyltransferase [Aquabacterium terrae]NRF69371.1 GNAT family N-acetyltransferase [Aquabacterium terrae]